jgi:hypothetical protein
MRKRALFLVPIVAGLLVGFGGLDQATAQTAAGEVKEMGTDPRDFAPKFMPYYRYTELVNGLEQNEIVLFGLMALSPKVAFTYELPLGYSRDILGTELCAGLPDQPCGGVVPGGTAVLPNGLPAEGDGKEVGIGDGNIRLFVRLGTALGMDWMAGSEFDLPLVRDPHHRPHADGDQGLELLAGPRGVPRRHELLRVRCLEGRRAGEGAAVPRPLVLDVSAPS